MNEIAEKLVNVGLEQVTWMLMLINACSCRRKLIPGGLFALSRMFRIWYCDGQSWEGAEKSGLYIEDFSSTYLRPD